MMTYDEFLNKYSAEINSRDFSNPKFKEYYQSIQSDRDFRFRIWNKFILDLIQLGINPLEKIESIPVEFFRGTGIEEMDIPNGVITIGDSSFRECPFLTKVVIPDSVKKVDDMAFYNCPDLREVSIGKGVEYIGYSIFGLCNNLLKVTYRGTKKEFWGLRKSGQWKGSVALFDLIHCTDGGLEVSNE